jgi:O-antigen/teichoic acid export membrane protein
MTTTRALARMDLLAWVLLYGGLFAIAAGLAVVQPSAALGWSLVACGTVAAVAGCILIVLRARMTPADPAPPQNPNRRPPP